MNVMPDVEILKNVEWESPTSLWSLNDFVQCPICQLAIFGNGQEEGEQKKKTDSQINAQRSILNRRKLGIREKEGSHAGEVWEVSRRGGPMGIQKYIQTGSEGR